MVEAPAGILLSSGILPRKEWKVPLEFRQPAFFSIKQKTPFSLGFRRFSRQKDPWKRNGRYFWNSFSSGGLRSPGRDLGRLRLDAASPRVAGLLSPIRKWAARSFHGVGVDVGGAGRGWVVGAGWWGFDQSHFHSAVD